MRSLFLIALLILTFCSTTQAQVFPDAVGFGSNWVFPQNSEYINVSNLNPDGAGSLKDAVERSSTSSGRIITFYGLSGYITVTSPIDIKHNNTYIAAHTSPNGITIRGSRSFNNTPLRTTNNVDGVVVRGLRIRRGNGVDKEVNGDCAALLSGQNIIFDRCSFSWSTDEVVSVYGAVKVTMQNCIFSEALMFSSHAYTTNPNSSGYKNNPVGPKPHSMGMIVGNGSTELTIYQNLFAHNNQRNPLVGGGAQGGIDYEMVGNVVYNWGDFGSVFGNDNPNSLNFINNVSIKGVNSNSIRYGVHIETSVSLYARGNYGEERTLSSQDEWLAIGVHDAPFSQQAPTSSQSSSPFNYPLKNVITKTRQETFDAVMSNAGATIDDGVDSRIKNEVATGTGGLINDPSEVGNFPSIISGGSTITDSDNDGIPDSEESVWGNDTFGYTNSLIFSPPNTSDNNDEFWFEAECANVGDGWSLVNDTTVSEGKYLLPPSGNNPNAGPTNSSSIITFDLVAQAGNYKFYGLVKATSGTEDSFWVRANGGEWIRWNQMGSSPNFEWREVHNHNAQNQIVPVTFNLTEGANIIEFGHREEGTALDKIYITKNGAVPNGFGETDQSCSEPILVTDITITPKDITMESGDTVNLNANVNPSNADDLSVTWSSDDTSIATVDNNGEVTAISGGTTSITVTSTDGGFTDSTNIIVNFQNNDEFWFEAECANVGNSWSLVNDTKVSGAKYLLSPSGNNSNNGPTDSNSIITFDLIAQAGVYKFYGLVKATSGSDDSFWVRANGGEWIRWNQMGSAPDFKWREVHNHNAQNQIVPVTFNLLEGENVVEFGHREDGTALDKVYFTKTGTVPDGFGETDESCTDPISVTDISLTPENISMEVGESINLVADINPPNATNSSVTWSSDDTEIATVDSNGTVTAISGGTTSIKASSNDGGFIASSNLNIPLDPISIELLPVDDAYLQSSTRVNNTLLRVNEGNRIVYLKYDLSSINGNLKSAELKFLITSDTGSGSAEIYKGDSSNWTETNINNANKPIETNLWGTSSNLSGTDKDVIVPLSINENVGGGFLSLIIKHVGSNDFAFASKEYGSRPGPRLVINYIPVQNTNLRAKISDINADSQDFISLFPNPTTNSVTITGINGKKEITILDSSGKRISTQTSKKANPTCNLSAYTRGIYYIRVEGVRTIKTFKVVKR